MFIRGGLHLVNTALIAISTVDIAIATQIEQKNDMIDNHRAYHFDTQCQASAVAKISAHSKQYMQYGCTDISKIKPTSLFDRLNRSVIAPSKKFFVSRLNNLYNLIKRDKAPIVEKLPFEGKIHINPAPVDRITSYAPEPYPGFLTLLKDRLVRKIKHTKYIVSKYFESWTLPSNKNKFVPDKFSPHEPYDPKRWYRVRRYTDEFGLRRHECVHVANPNRIRQITSQN